MEKNLVYCLSNGESTAIYLDTLSLTDSLQMEFDNMHEDDAVVHKFTITSKFMTDEELDNLPEFDGF